MFAFFELIIKNFVFFQIDLMKKNVLNVIFVKKVLKMVQHSMVICVYMVDSMKYVFFIRKQKRELYLTF
jgi:hypothetical protein